MFEQLSFEQLLIFPASVSDRSKASPRNVSSDVQTHTNKRIKSVSDSVSDGVSDTVSDTVSDRSKASLTKPCVNKYSPAKRKTAYYRLSYRTDNKVKHIHIRGGNINSSIATRRARQLQTMIDRGATVAELLSAIADYRGTSRFEWEAFHSKADC